MNSIEVVLPGTPEYAALDPLSRPVAKWFDYAPLIKRYNEAGIEHLLLFSYPTAHTHNIKSMLTRKGLKQGEDYHLAKVTRDAEGNRVQSEEKMYMLKKLSNKKIE